MQQPKPVLDPPFPLLPPPSSFRSSPRSSKRSLRLPSKHSPAPNSFPDPSSGLLALLVTVAGSSPVHGRPLDSEIPPDFLCPCLHIRSSSPSSAIQDPSSPSDWAPCDAEQPIASSSQLTSPIPVSADQWRHPRKRRTRGSGSNNIADKFEQSEDGRWRKADSWELYGSSSCAITQCMDAIPTNIQEDQVSTSPSSPPTLPNGWGKGADKDDMTGIILALSLSLAISLILFMIGMVLWRKKRRKSSTGDTEKTPSSVDTGEETSEMKRARTQQRMWARAYAKWMANVRQSARMRRKRATMAATRGSDTDLLSEGQQPEASTSALSLARMPTAVNRTATHSSSRSYPSHRITARPRSRASSTVSSESRADTHIPVPPPSHPPAYIPNPSSAIPLSHGWSYHYDPLSGPPHHSNTCNSCTDTPDDSSSPLPYEAPVHSAHVATDDKAVLAQMARMASAPPTGDGPSSPATSGASSEMHPSVPVLEDDVFEALPAELEVDVNADTYEERTARGPSTSGSTHDAFSLTLQASSPYSVSRDLSDCEVPSYAEDAIRHRAFVLPPPPRKVPLTGPTFYEYPNEFEEDITTLGPPLGPSSPPFEEPSAPPFEFEDGPGHAHMIVPSAPPLDLAEGLPHEEGLVPSAPPLDNIDHGAAPEVDGDLPRLSMSGLQPRAPPLVPDNQENVNASSGAASPHQPNRYGDVSPPQYLP